MWQLLRRNTYPMFLFGLVQFQKFYVKWFWSKQNTQFAIDDPPCSSSELILRRDPIKIQNQLNLGHNPCLCDFINLNLQELWMICLPLPLCHTRKVEQNVCGVQTCVEIYNCVDVDFLLWACKTNLSYTCSLWIKAQLHIIPFKHFYNLYCL